MKLPDHWWVFALMIFAVASGQMGRLGQAYERGAAIGRKQLLIELSMLPAFGGLGGALAVEYGWPTWVSLASGIAAGWTGFGTFRLIVTIAKTVGQQMAGKADPPA